MIVIGLFALLAVGPDKLPTMIKTVVRTYRQLRRAADDLRASTGIDELLHDEELRELAQLRKQKLLDLDGIGANVAPKKKIAKPQTSEARVASEHEFPSEGIDVAEARHRLAQSQAKEEPQGATHG